MECFKAFTDYDTKLLEYATIAFIECISDIIKLMIEKRVKVTISILGQAKKSYGPFASLSQTTRVELLEAIFATGDDQKVRSQWPFKEDGFCPLPDPSVFNDIFEEDPF